MNKLRSSACLCVLPSVLLLLATAAAAKDLAIDRATLHQIEDGPPIDASIQFQPSETVYLSFRATGFETKQKDEELQSLSLRYRIEVQDPFAVYAIAPILGAITTDMRKEDKDWAPKVRAEIRLPDFAARGKYKVLLWLKDELSNAEARREMTFTVTGRDVAPATELTVRNFGFYRTEDDRRPLTEAVYAAGSPVLVRFDIVGYQMSPAPKNAFQIEYGLTVTGPDNKVKISQPTAATENYENPYPRRWLPAGFRLDLPKEFVPGRYEVVMEVRDKQADKKLEVRQFFLVE